MFSSFMHSTWHLCSCLSHAHPLLRQLASLLMREQSIEGETDGEENEGDFDGIFVGSSVVGSRVGLDVEGMSVGRFVGNFLQISRQSCSPAAFLPSSVQSVKSSQSSQNP